MQKRLNQTFQRYVSFFGVIMQFFWTFYEQCLDFGQLAPQFSTKLDGGVLYEQFKF